MNTPNQTILLVLLKDISNHHTVSSIAKTLHKNRSGIWKHILELEQQELITLHTTGTGTTNARIITLNWNPFTEKTLSFTLAQEATKHKRWQFTFANIEPTTEFFLLYGSTIHSPTTAKDIDTISVSKEKNLPTIREIIRKVQTTQEKKIHSINYTPQELAKEVKNSNSIILDALNKGTVLFGQEQFVQFLKRFHHP